LRQLRAAARFTPAVRMSSSVASASSQEMVIVGKADEKPEQVGLTPFSGFPREQLGRPVRITEPAKNVCQTGSFTRGGGWTLKWDTQERWENPLMGWASTADPLSNLELDFDSLESAQYFCEKNGWDHYVYYQPKKKFIGGNKSYGAAFSWDKRTRKQTK